MSYVILLGDIYFAVEVHSCYRPPAERTREVKSRFKGGGYSDQPCRIRGRYEFLHNKQKMYGCDSADSV